MWTFYGWQSDIAGSNAALECSTVPFGLQILCAVALTPLNARVLVCTNYFLVVKVLAVVI